MAWFCRNCRLHGPLKGRRSPSFGHATRGCSWLRRLPVVGLSVDKKKSNANNNKTSKQLFVALFVLQMSSKLIRTNVHKVWESILHQSSFTCIVCYIHLILCRFSLSTGPGPLHEYFLTRCYVLLVSLCLDIVAIVFSSCSGSCTV